MMKVKGKPGVDTATRDTCRLCGKANHTKCSHRANGLDHTLIIAAAERSPEKWGKYTVGTWIPIFSEEEARKA